MSVAPTPLTPPDHRTDDPPGVTSGVGQSALFGRGMLYVVVFCFQTVAATVVSPVLAHLIGPAEFGRLATGVALYQLLTVVAVVGLDQALVLQRAEDGHDRSARGLLVVSFALTLGVTTLLALTGPLWARAIGFDAFVPLLWAVLLWTVAGACVQVMMALLLAQDRLRVFTVVSALAAVGGQVIGIGFVLLGSHDATTYAWGGACSQFAAMVVALVATRPRLAGLVDRPVVARAFRIGVPLAVGSMATFVLNAGDRIVVQRLLGADQVGRYQVAYNIGLLGVLLVVFTSQSWTPRFAAIRDTDERRELLGRSRNEVYRLLMPIIVGITLGAPLALRIVAPPSFGPETLSVVVFLVALSAFPVAAGGATSRELFTLRRGRAIAVATAVAAVLNVVLNLLLVPTFGITGSAAATVVAFGVLALAQRRALPRGTDWPGTPVRLVIGVVAACLFSAASILLPQTLEWNLARLVVALGCVPWLVRRLVAARTGTVPSWGRWARTVSRAEGRRADG